MSILNQPREPFFNSDEEREQAAIAYLPTILSFAPEYLDFDFSNLVLKYLKTKKDDKAEFERMMDIQEMMENILLRNHFAEISPAGNMLRILTDKGRHLRLAGSLQRHKEIEEEKQKVVFNDHSINIGGDNHGNANTGQGQPIQKVDTSSKNQNEKEDAFIDKAIRWAIKKWWAWVILIISSMCILYWQLKIQPKLTKELEQKEKKQ